MKPVTDISTLDRMIAHLEYELSKTPGKPDLDLLLELQELRDQRDDMIAWAHKEGRL